jgi:hypothetical protein
MVFQTITGSVFPRRNRCCFRDFGRVAGGAQDLR